LRKKIVDLCKKVSTCHYCGALNGVVKKCGLLKISHEKYRTQKKTSEVLLKKLAEYDDVVENNKELQSMLASGLIHVLNPLEVLNLFERIPDDDIPLLLMDKDAARPSYMILQVNHY
jgi:DNA-directed RNA polymerase III subunit RPC1